MEIQSCGYPVSVWAAWLWQCQEKDSIRGHWTRQHSRTAAYYAYDGKSLQNLGMDYVDLYIYHMWDYGTPLYEIMEGLMAVVKAEKPVTSVFQTALHGSWQKANALAEKEGFAKFVSVQGHYNLIFREEEQGDGTLLQGREHCADALQCAGGGTGCLSFREKNRSAWRRIAMHVRSTAVHRLLDQIIIERAALLAEQKGVTLTEIALAWLLQKTAAPVVGATKIHHIEGAAKAVDVAADGRGDHFSGGNVCAAQAGWRYGGK